MAGTARRPVSNPLALAVLGTLRERAMHPYEMAATMRERGKEYSIKLNYGSLYTIVGSLARHGLIEAIGAQREGRRPERTVYSLTDAGRAELEDWLSELVAVPEKEYPRFEAALAFLPALAPRRVAALLHDRVAALESEIAGLRGELGSYGLPRLFSVEIEYHLALQEADLAWTRRLAAELDDGSFEWLGEWQTWQATGEMSPEATAYMAELAERARRAAAGPAHGDGEETTTD